MAIGREEEGLRREGFFFLLARRELDRRKEICSAGGETTLPPGGKISPLRTQANQPRQLVASRAGSLNLFHFGCRASQDWQSLWDLL